MSDSRAKKSMLPPINLIFKFLQQQSEVTIWLFEQNDLRIQGKVRGFDEFMNIVVDDATEILLKTSEKTTLGRILLKGDSISLILSLEV